RRLWYTVHATHFDLPRLPRRARECGRRAAVCCSTSQREADASRRRPSIDYQPAAHLERRAAIPRFEMRKRIFLSVLLSSAVALLYSQTLDSSRLEIRVGFGRPDGSHNIQSIP